MRLDGINLESIFRSASGGAIELSFVDRGDYACITSTRETSVGNLNYALDNLIVEQPPAHPRIGLLYADRFAPKTSVLGIMFDVDVVRDTPPREGCAVFLDAVRECRNGDEAQFAETLFTTVHELGHVFNLWHENSPRNFLATSPRKGEPPFSTSAHQFLSKHEEYLARVVENEVRPTGSRFGKRLAGYPVETVDSEDLPQNIAGETNSTSSETGLQQEHVAIDISVTSDVFWYFEPVELELTVTAKGRIAIVPDTLDPGYPTFEIWIEDPIGERRRYRPLCFYCRPSETFTVEPTKPFRRDISIFGESGGFTFRVPGIHKIWVRWNSGSGGVIESNPVEVELRRAAPDSDVYRALSAFLTDPKIARLAFHRDGNFRAKQIKRVMDRCAALAREGAVGGVSYSLGRMLAQRVFSGGRGQLDSPEEAIRLLEPLSQHEFLGDHRRAKVEAVIDELRTR